MIRALKYAAVALASVVVLCNQAFAADTIKWRMAHFTTGGPTFEFAQDFANKVKTITEGRIEIEVFPAGTLGAAGTVTDTVEKGVAEAGFNWMGYDWGRNVATVLFSGYPAGMNDVQMLHWLTAGEGSKLQREFREKEFGVVSLPVFVSPSEIFLHSEKPIRTLADLAGLKFRTAGAWLEMAKTLGAAPVTAPGADVYPMLERGVIDATEWSTPAVNVPAGFHKIAKYVIVPGIHQPASGFESIFNKKAWDSLTDQDRTLVEQAARLNLFESWTKLSVADVTAFQTFEKEGNEVITLPAEVQQEVKKISTEWSKKKAAENEWFAKIYASQTAFRKQWSSARRYREFAID